MESQKPLMTNTLCRWGILVLLVVLIVSYVFLSSYFLNRENCLQQNTFEDESQPTSVLSSTGALFKAHIIRELPKNEQQWRMQSSSYFYPRHSKLNCTKWVVLTTVFEPEPAVYDFFKMSGWCVVVVGDNKTPRNYLELLAKDVPVKNNIAGNSIFLDVETQKQLPYKVAAALPWNHYSRKNIGYLYAIHHGAQTIYDTDDDNILIDPTQIQDSSAAFKKVQTFANHKSVPAALNLYPFFAPVNNDNRTTIDTMWPRGFPLDSIVASTSSNLSLVDFNGREPSVIQLLQQHDPDLDAIFRLTHSLPVYFKTNDKMIIVPINCYAPFNAQSTVWRRSGFWGLYLPMTVTGRVSDIWRSYFIQKILAMNNMSISYTSAKVRQDRNVHTYLGDFNSEQDLYLKSGELIKYLNQYQPKHTNEAGGKNSLELMQEWYELMVDMWKIDIIQMRDITLSRLWIEDLTNIHYSIGEIPSIQSH
eukprot:TRINITY_DN3923_c0_g1_i1.p1 TRINITY_DN3923_c0_g1~~TRINITY_DN3923_c0_g1_i1.p1  ORF type:complete len:475 (-),score=53.05 TRINITY_DN3923_c0_g1_i1:116-1540(-)